MSITIISKILIATILTMIFITTTTNGAAKKEPNGHVIFIYDRSGSFMSESKISFSLLSKLLKYSKAKRFSKNSIPKRFSIVVVDSKSDLVADKIMHSNKDVLMMKAIFAKRLVTRGKTIGSGSQISEGFFMAQELAKRSKLPTFLVVHSDLIEGNFNETVDNVLKTMGDFSRVLIIGANDRRKWRQEAVNRGLSNVTFIHKEELATLNIADFFNETFGDQRQ